MLSFARRRMRQLFRLTPTGGNAPEAAGGAGAKNDGAVLSPTGSCDSRCACAGDTNTYCRAAANRHPLQRAVALVTEADPGAVGRDERAIKRVVSALKRPGCQLVDRAHRQEGTACARNPVDNLRAVGRDGQVVIGARKTPTFLMPP